MGREATCTVRFEGREAQGKARLEPDELTFRGEDLRLKIPLRTLRSVKARDGVLAIELPSGERAELDLGPQAETWAQRILHPKSRVDKLGAKPGLRAVLLEVADRDLPEELARAGIDVSEKARGRFDLVFLGIESQDDLKAVARRRRLLTANGALWIVFPKGRRDIREADVMTAGKEAGLVDVKVVGFSPTHTALKFVIPRSDR